jgi:hypothetical protein
MRELHTYEQKLKKKMVQKLLNDPDKYERMFAARYLFKYDYTECKPILLEILDDKDEEVVRCVVRLFREKGEIV